MTNPTTTNNKNETTNPFFEKSNQSLQELLHTLLTRLSDSSEIIKSWPEGGNGIGEDNSIHVETTTKLITSIHKIVDAIRLVEERVNPNIGDDGDNNPTTEQEQQLVLANQLRQTAVPLDLLDMMDTNTLNPDCFARGLLNEALRQFSNLRHRKASMNMLAQMVQNGLNERERQLQQLTSKKVQDDEQKNISTSHDEEEQMVSKKRKRNLDDDNDDIGQGIIEPQIKKEKA